MKENTERNPFSKQKIIVFDMDGTLYPHDGDNKHFKNSTLYKIIDENSIQFVINHEDCSRINAEILIEEGHKDAIGVENLLKDMELQELNILMLFGI
jgi:FMN phosphatase YigB (HAD superfamily)